MMDKHTPGPWHWHNCGGYHVLVSGPASEVGRYPDKSRTISIAREALAKARGEQP